MEPSELATKIGFKFGKSGAHAARSMMIQDLTQLLLSLPENASLHEYRANSIDANLLHKSSENARKLPFLHLFDFYELSQDIPLFKNRGTDVASAPWYHLGLEYSEKEGARILDHHLSLADKQAARDAVANQGQKA